jgi:peroxiredoxin Q/BCP
MGIIERLFGRSAGKEPRPMLKPGDTAPDFEVSDHHGRTVRLRDLRGRRVVLWFYPKADTPG